MHDVTFRCDGVSGHTAGAGGSVGGFDLEKIGLGTALVAGSVATAWNMSRRRATADES